MLMSDCIIIPPTEGMHVKYWPAVSADVFKHLYMTDLQIYYNGIIIGGIYIEETDLCVYV